MPAIVNSNNLFLGSTGGGVSVHYTAGPNIDITENIISGKDWSSEIENATTGKLDTTAFNSGDFYPMTGNPSGFLTAHQSLTDYYQKNETSSKEELSAAIANAGDQLRALEPVYINVDNEIGVQLWHLMPGSGIKFTENSGLTQTLIEVTGVPTAAMTAYYQKNETSSKQEINAAITGKQDNLTFAGSNSVISSINGSALAGGTSETTIDLSAGEGISIVETADKLVISCTGAGGSNVHWYIDTPQEHASADIDLTIQTTATLGGGYDRYLMNGTAFIGELIPSADTQTDAGKFLTVTAGSPRWGELPSASFGIKTEVVANSGMATANGILYIVTGN